MSRGTTKVDSNSLRVAKYSMPYVVVEGRAGERRTYMPEISDPSRSTAVRTTIQPITHIKQNVKRKNDMLGCCHFRSFENGTLENKAVDGPSMREDTSLEWR